MAVTAKFQADFSSFIDAIDKAELALVDFGKGANKVETSLNRMVDNFSGRKLIQEASLLTIAVEKVGGISVLTAKELENVGAKANEAADKLRRLGIEVPQGLQKLADETKTANTHFVTMRDLAGTLAGAFGVAFGVGAIVNFGKELFAAADNLEKLHDKTGISVDGLQRFQVAGDEAGNTIDDITNAITKMEDKLSGGDASAAGALKKLGLSFEDLKGLTPENQFIAISDALRKIQDPAEQVNIAIDLFGKAGANVLPTLKRGFDDLKGAAVGMSEDTVKALDNAGDALARWWRAGKGIVADAAVGFARIVEAGFDPATLAAQNLDREASALNDTLKKMTETASRGAGLSEWTDHVKELSLHVPTLNDALAAQAEIERDLDPATKKLIDAYTEMNSAGIGWQGTLETLSGDVAEAIRFYLDAGVSQKTLADAYGVTAAQVKAVASEIKDEQDALKREAQSIEQVSRLWDEFNQIAGKGGSAFDNQIESIDRWALDLEAKAQKAGTDTAAFYEALTSLWNAKLHEASMRAESEMESVAASAISAFDEMNSAVMGIETSFDGWNRAIMAVDSSLRRLSRGNTLDLTQAARDPEINALLKSGWSLENAEAIKLGRQWGFTPKLYDAMGNSETTPSKAERVPGYWSGVQNAPGGWSMVGERGPEAMYVPKGSTILPTGSMPDSGPQVIQLVVDGRVLAQIVDNHQTRSMKQGRQFPGS